MQTTAGVSILQMSVNEDSNLSTQRELFRPTTRTVRKTDWDLVIVKADKLISAAGAMAAALAVLYFTPILASMMLK